MATKMMTLLLGFRNVVVVAPSPFGFSPFGYGGFGGGFGMSPFGYAPVFGIGSLFSLMFGLAFISILFSVVSGVASGVSNMNKKEEDKDSW